MVTFPKEFIATKLPGYFWNTKTKTLFSIKGSGVLRELKKSKPNRFNRYRDAYQVSYLGCRSYLDMPYLTQLVECDSVIPVKRT